MKGEGILSIMDEGQALKLARQKPRALLLTTKLLMVSCNL